MFAIGNVSVAYRKDNGKINFITVLRKKMIGHGSRPGAGN
jgi:hypothetical protein